MISLKATESGRPFHIHQSLLASKSKTIASAFEKNFSEKEKRVYTFQDTTEGTLARFIEWAYTGDYPFIIKATHTAEPRVVKLEPKEIKVEDGEKKENTDLDVVALNSPESDLTPENHPLLSHIRLYIFSSIYMIPDLQKMAFDRVTATFSDINALTALDTQLATIAALRVAFRKLLPNDELLGWLAQYAAYNLCHLRVQRDFHDLLQEAPNLASRMMLSVNPAQSPPWMMQPPKHTFAHYAPDYQYDEDA